MWWFITIFPLLLLRHVYRISRNMDSFWNYNWTTKAQRYTKTKLSEQNQRVIKRCKSKENGITLLWEVQRECLQNRWSVRWWFVPKRMKRELVFFSNHLIIDNQGLATKSIKIENCKNRFLKCTTLLAVLRCKKTVWFLVYIQCTQKNKQEKNFHFDKNQHQIGLCKKKPKLESSSIA